MDGAGFIDVFYKAVSDNTVDTLSVSWGGSELFYYAAVGGTDETGELLATGETTHVVCDSNGRPKPLPEKYRRYFDSENAESPSAKSQD